MIQKRKSHFQIQGEIETRWKEKENNQIVYEIFSEALQEVDQIRFLLISEKCETIWSQEALILQNFADRTVIEVDLTEAIEQFLNAEPMRWKTYIEVQTKDQEYIYRLTNTKIKEKLEKREKYYDKGFLYGKCFGKIGDYEICPYYTINGRMGIVIYELGQRYVASKINQVTDIRIKGSNLKIEFLYHSFPGCKPKCVSMVLRNSKEVENMRYEMQIQTTGKEGEWNKGVVQLDLSAIRLRALYWDVYLEYENEKGVIYQTKLKNYDQNFLKRQFMSFWRDDTYRLGKNEIFYPYMTTKNALAFQCREKGEYDGITFRLKERIAAILYYLFKPHWQGKKIYLVYEKFCMMAQDNGYYFFKYCMENDIEKKLDRKIYYVMDKNSPDRAKLAPYEKNVVDFMSVRYIIYLLASKLLISTDTRTHAYAWRRKNSIIFQYMDSKKLVFLQHGVTALKKVDFLYGKGRNGDCNLFVVTSDMERDIVKDYFGYQDKEIAVSGFARWDVLCDKSEGSNEILLMPTWRNWLEEVGDDIFKASDYYQNYMKLLTSDRLKNLLETYDLKLNFYLHPKFRDYISDFRIDAERIRLIPFGEEPLNELMMKCRMLITDYSSVCWDVYYQGKPVIFYQFDLEDYYELHGSYIDMKKDLFGPEVEDISSLLDELEKIIQNNFRLEDRYESMRHSYYKYIDNNNSQRICEAIAKKGW